MCAYLSIHDCLSFLHDVMIGNHRTKPFFTRLWSAIIGTKQPKVNQSPQQWRRRNPCTRICRFLVVGNIFRLETCMNSLVKVLPYSKLNFQGEIFFTQNWCNITLRIDRNFCSVHEEITSIRLYTPCNPLYVKVYTTWLRLFRMNWTNNFDQSL